MNYYIKPSEWEQILSKLRSRKDIRTKNESKLRRFIEAIWYIVRSGVNGGYYHLIMAHGERYMIDFRLGLKRRFGMSYSSHFIANQIWNIP